MLAHWSFKWLLGAEIALDPPLTCSRSISNQATNNTKMSKMSFWKIDEFVLVASVPKTRGAGPPTRAAGLAALCSSAATQYARRSIVYLNSHHPAPSHLTPLPHYYSYAAGTVGVPWRPGGCDFLFLALLVQPGTCKETERRLAGGQVVAAAVGFVHLF